VFVQLLADSMEENWVEIVLKKPGISDREQERRLGFGRDEEHLVGWFEG